MAYIDGFLTPLPKKNRAAHKKMSRRGKRMIFGGFKTFLKM